MKIERKGEEYGSFTLEISERLEAQIRKAANEMVAFAKKDPAEAEKLIDNYCGIIESSVVLLLSIIGLAFYRPTILSYVFSTLQTCLEPLLSHLKREALIREERDRQNN